MLYAVDTSMSTYGVPYAFCTVEGTSADDNKNMSERPNRKPTEMRFCILPTSRFCTHAFMTCEKSFNHASPHCARCFCYLPKSGKKIRVCQSSTLVLFPKIRSTSALRAILTPRNSLDDRTVTNCDATQA